MIILNGCKTALVAMILIMLHSNQSGVQVTGYTSHDGADSTVPLPVKKGKRKKPGNPDTLALSAENKPPAYIPYNQTRQSGTVSPAYPPQDLPLGGEILKSIIRKHIRN